MRDEERRLVSDTPPSEPDQEGVAVAPPEDLESRLPQDLEIVDDGGLHSITGRVVQREPPLCVTHLKVLTQVGAGDTIGQVVRKERGIAHEEDEDNRVFCDSAWDDVTGAALDPKEVQRACLKEIEYIHRKGVYQKIRRQDALKKGIKILRTRWVDVNKGDSINTNHRSRFVAMEFNTSKVDGLFASTLPLEALKMLISCAATQAGDSVKEEEDQVMMVNDVARAYFEAPVTRIIAVELPEEDGGGKDSEFVGLLQKSLYGTRDAAANFQKEVRKFMQDHNFVVGKYNSSTYYHRAKNLRVMVHGRAGCRVMVQVLSGSQVRSKDVLNRSWSQ